MTVSILDLRSIFLFAKFTDSELDMVRQALSAREYPAHAFIFTQGESSPGLWFVRRGRVRLFRTSLSGREFTLCIARADSLPCLGGCPLMDGDVSPVSAQALEPATVYFIERQSALEIASPQEAMAKLIARVLANHARYLMHLSSGLALRCSMPRLADLLLTYMKERGHATANGVELDLDVTHELLASALGTTPQMIAQDFLKLERAGVVDARGKHILILHRERLADLIM
ncbi:MAG: Crp/Fnr family transcriptional regulator [Acidobacteriota bacterium]